MEPSLFRTADAFAPFLKSLNKVGIQPTIVAGQAVNIWASVFERWDEENTKDVPVPRLKDLRPFVSRDIDLSDVRAAELCEMREVIDANLPNPDLRIDSTDAGTFLIESEDGGGPLKVQVMRRVFGISNKEIDENKANINFKGADVWIPDPLVLLKAKLANLVDLDQSARHDFRHVLMLIRCVRAFIGNAVQQNKDSRDILCALKRCQELQQTKNARRVETQYALELGRCIPIPQLLERAVVDSKIKNYLMHQHGIQF